MSTGEAGSPLDFLARFAGPLAWLVAGLLLLFGGVGGPAGPGGPGATWDVRHWVRPKSEADLASPEVVIPLSWVSPKPGSSKTATPRPTTGGRCWNL